MDCPACGHALEEAQLEHVTVHDCANCAGMWFEGDEPHQPREIVGGNESHVQELRNFMTVFRLLEMRVGVEHPVAAQMLDRMNAGGL